MALTELGDKTSSQRNMNGVCPRHPRIVKPSLGTEELRAGPAFFRKFWDQVDKGMENRVSVVTAPSQSEW